MFSALTATKPPKRLVQFLTSRIAIPFSDETLWTIDHDQDQYDREVHEPERSEPSKHFENDGNQNGAHDRPFDASKPSDDDHDDQIKRCREQEGIRMKVHREVSKQSTRDPGEHRTDDERENLVTRRVHSHGF